MHFKRFLYIIFLIRLMTNVTGYTVPVDSTSLPDLSSVPANDLTIIMAMTSISTIPDDAFKDAPHITTLKITDNPLTNLGTNAFRGLPSLTELTLLSNSLTTFPNLTHLGATLQLLTIYKNELTRIDSVLFSNMFALINVNLFHNELTSDCIQTIANGAPELKVLNLGMNNLASLKSSDIPTMTRLVTLSMTNSDIRSIPIFPSMPRLQRLRLSNNPIQNISIESFNLTPKIFKIWLDQNTGLTVLPNMTALTALKMINISETGIKEFHTTNFPTLDTVYLAGNKISNFPDLRISPPVEIDLSSNTISDVPLTKVSNFNSVTKLWLQGNMLQTFPFDMLNNAPNLVILSLANNQFSTIPNLTSYDTTRTTQLDIDMTENPLRCDERLVWMKNFSSPNFKITLSEMPCVSPPDLVNKTWTEISTADLLKTPAPLISIRPVYIRSVVSDIYIRDGHSLKGAFEMITARSRIHCAVSCQKESPSNQCFGFRYLNKNCELFS